MQENTYPDGAVTEYIMTCSKNVPNPYRNIPWKHPELKNGTAILHTDEGMNCYMAAYGEMHYIKCLTAMQNFPYETLKNEYEIVDWGCGQGIGSLTVIECLKNHNLLKNLQQVTLIEASHSTLQRAKTLVESMVGVGVEIIARNNYLPTVIPANSEINSLTYRSSNIIHVFSNILDVADFDFTKIAKLAVPQGKNVYILCIGPMNHYAYRIDQFCTIFDVKEYFSNISEKVFRRTTKTFHYYGCKTRCFRTSSLGTHPENYLNFVKPTLIGETPIIDEYDPRYAVDCGLITEKMRELSEIIGNAISSEDIFILKPKIQGDSVDALIVSREKGILLVKLWEKNLNDYQFLTTINAKGQSETDFQSIQLKTNLEIPFEPSPLAIMDNIQRNLVTHHLSDLLDIIANDYKQIDIIKKVIVFASNTTEEARQFFAGHWNYNTLLGKDLFADERKQFDFVRLCYFNYPNKLFDDQLMHRFLHMLSPKWHSYKEGQAITMTPVQKRLSDSRARARHKISGVAGSGKTQVLCQRAVNAQKRTGGDILILSYNITLANYLYYRLDMIAADFPWDKIRVSHYHEFFKSEANNCGLHAGLASFDNGHFFDKYVDSLHKYDAIFIDEVQDYKPEWLSNIQKFLKINGEFVVFGDSSQNIFNRALDQYGDVNLGAAIGGYWNKELKKSERIANPRISNLANALKIKYTNGVDLIEMPRQDELQVKIAFDSESILHYEYHNETPSPDMLVTKISEVIAQMEYNPKDTVVLAQVQSILCDVDYSYRQRTGQSTSITFASKEEIDYLRKAHGILNGNHVTFRYTQDLRAKDRNKKLAFSMDSRHLKLSTIHSFKGWEAKNVILILLPMTTDGSRNPYAVGPEQNLPALIYTAITRAKENLYLINCGNREYKDFFEKNMNI